MKKLNIYLEHCYGISKFKEELNFSDCKVVAIYASNGVMKTSFAKTFHDLSNGSDSKDMMNDTKHSIREIKDENGNDIIKENVFVIEPHRDDYNSDKIPLLLVDQRLQKKYADIYQKIDEAKNNLLKELSRCAGIRSDKIEEKILNDFSNTNFFDVLESHEQEVLDITNSPFQNIKYAKILTSKSKYFLQEFHSEIEDYIQTYNSLLDNSKYLSQNFNLFNTSSIQKSLTDNHFFDADHFVTLKNKNTIEEIKDAEELQKIIEDVKNNISNDPTLKEKWLTIYSKLSNNEDLRSFSAYLQANPDILRELSNPELFARKLWISYLFICKDSFKSYLSEYKNGISESKQILVEANKQQTIWDGVIKLFNQRFFVPFEIKIENRSDVILKNNAPHIVFNFNGSSRKNNVQKPALLDVLSTGEQKALYILNLLFEIEARKEKQPESLFIFDDIADSFDYKNKYAIIQYLKDISKSSSFRMIILTHNFDFLRTIRSRGVVYSPNCYFASKNNTMIKLEQTNNILTPPINSWLTDLTDPKKLISSIPFARNIVEYTNGNDDTYKKLTSLLHYTQKTNTILVSDLNDILTAIFPGTKTSEPSNLNSNVIDVIYTESKDCLNNSKINLEHKIVLSIGIRLRSEKYMLSKISNSNFVESINTNQFSKLFKQYRKENPNDVEILELLDAVNLMTATNIHLNSFMYEPILDMTDDELKNLYKKLLEIYP